MPRPDGMYRGQWGGNEQMSKNRIFGLCTNNLHFQQISHRESIVLIYRTPKLLGHVFFKIGNSENGKM